MAAHGLKNSVPDNVKDNRPRIWCNICCGQNITIGDTRRHWREAGHPMDARGNPTGQAYWCFENYFNSRHGGPNNSAAQLARARVAQVAAFLQNGTPTTAAVLNRNTTGHAVLASNALLRGSSANINQQIQTHYPRVMQVAPLVGAAPTQQPVLAQPPPLHSIAPNPQPAIIMMPAAPLPVTAPIPQPTLFQAGPQPVVAPNPQYPNAPIGHPQAVAPPTVQYQYPDPDECSRYGFDRNWVKPS